MNLFKHLFSKSDDAELDMSDEAVAEREAEAKKQRILFHREHVRNGPRKATYWSSGQQRRLKARDKKVFERKVNHRRRRAWMAQQADIATLRGHLIILGQIECRHESTTFTATQRAASATWVVQKYGPRDDEGRLVLGESTFVDALGSARAAFLQFNGVTDRGDGTFVTNRPATVSA